MGISERVVLITGATGAVGQVVANVFAQTGARLVLTGRRETALQELGQGLGLSGSQILVAPADLADAANVTQLVKAATDAFGGVDVLLNIAGGWSGGQRLADLALDDWDSTMAMNLTSAFLVNRAVLPHMIEQGWGRIINFGSRAAVEPGLRQAAYNVSKAAVVALTGSIARDYRGKGITANVLLPSIIDTPSNRLSMPDSDLSRWVRPQDLAETMLYLCSDAAVSINGAAIPVYGGL